jgi:hypothetical protein
LEYARPDRTAAVAVVFRTSGAIDQPVNEYCFRPRGLHPGAEYKITLDNTGLSYRASGAELALHGVPVRLETVFASELLTFEQITG